jgi:hypothetical protein
MTTASLSYRHDLKPRGGATAYGDALTRPYNEHVEQER